MRKKEMDGGEGEEERDRAVARYPYCGALKTIKSLYRSPLTHQS